MNTFPRMKGDQFKLDYLAQAGLDEPILFESIMGIYL